MGYGRSCWSGGNWQLSEEEIRNREQLRDKIGQGDFPEQCPDNLNNSSDDVLYWLTTNLIHQICVKMDGNTAG